MENTLGWWVTKEIHLAEEGMPEFQGISRIQLASST